MCCSAVGGFVASQGPLPAALVGSCQLFMAACLSVDMQSYRTRMSFYECCMFAAPEGHVHALV